MRESFQPLFIDGYYDTVPPELDWKTGEGYKISYPATDGVQDYFDVNKEETVNRVRSPIHMPRWASRITLVITGVRVERLQEITEADAMAEGANPIDMFCPTENHCPPGTMSYVEGFAELWEQINGKSHPWSSNPWVWVVSFKKV